mmetsp:Transcript_54062/g.161829  ORF Transcript_54062/g.161829 Transcript_54062/m.161829 type:complete len:322 (+) Transcript_54062:360-1325(+)
MALEPHEQVIAPVVGRRYDLDGCGADHPSAATGSVLVVPLAGGTPPQLAFAGLVNDGEVARLLVEEGSIVVGIAAVVLGRRPMTNVHRDGRELGRFGPPRRQVPHPPDEGRAFLRGGALRTMHEPRRRRPLRLAAAPLRDVGVHAGIGRLLLLLLLLSLHLLIAGYRAAVQSGPPQEGIDAALEILLRDGMDLLPPPAVLVDFVLVLLLLVFRRGHPLHLHLPLRLRRIHVLLLGVAAIQHLVDEILELVLLLRAALLPDGGAEGRGSDLLPPRKHGVPRLTDVGQSRRLPRDDLHVHLHLLGLTGDVVHHGEVGGDGYSF